MNNTRKYRSSTNNRPAPSLFADVGRGHSGSQELPLQRRESAATGALARSSPSRNGRSAEKDRYIAQLEVEVDTLKNRCAVYQQQVKELGYEVTKLMARVSNKKDLRSKFRWSTADSTYAGGIIKFCKEWLFPRYKFFHSNWMEYSSSRKSLCALVIKHCPIPVDADREDYWTRIIAPTMAKKYADMRCNINNDVRKALTCEYTCVL